MPLPTSSDGARDDIPVSLRSAARARSAPSVAVIRAEEHILKLDIAMTAFLVCAPAVLAGCKESSADYTSQDEYSYERRDAFRTDMDQAIDKLEARTDRVLTREIRKWRQAR